MSEVPRPVSLVRGPRHKRIAVIKGQDYGRFTDFYHGVLTASWPMFFVQLGGLFVVVNLGFALLYVLDRGGIANARPGSFADAFFFSVQTLGTLGYGLMAPRSLYVNLLVTVESFTGILIIALFTGILFARFSRPFARVVFSKVAVVTPFDGVPTLMLRAANQRGNSVLDASVSVSLASQYTTREGVHMRRFRELKLVRPNNPLFALSWTVMHHIDEASPLYGIGLADTIEHDMEIIVMLNGMDETISMTASMRATPIWRKKSTGTGGSSMWSRWRPPAIAWSNLNQFHDTMGELRNLLRQAARTPPRNSAVAKSAAWAGSPSSRCSMRSEISKATPTIAAIRKSASTSGNRPLAIADSKSSRSSSKPAITSGVSMRKRLASAAWRRWRKSSRLRTTNSKKVRKEFREMKVFQGVGLPALLAQPGPDGKRHLIADRLIHFLLGLEVIVEGARGQRRGADDVAHRGGAEADLRKHPCAPRRGWSGDSAP